MYLYNKFKITRNNIIWYSGTGAVIVRAEEALIVILVLLLWAAAIALFFNRWGKIRMLEPYQPKFQQQHRSSCTTIEQNQLQVKYIIFYFRLKRISYYLKYIFFKKNKIILSIFSKINANI